MAVKKVAKKASKKVTKKATPKKTVKKTVASKEVQSASASRRKVDSRSPEAMEDQALEMNNADELNDTYLDPRRVLLKSRRIHGNIAKKKIARDMLERYTGHSLDMFEQQIIITNFHYYVERFNTLLDDSVYTQGSAFKAASSKKSKVTIVEFGIGSAMAALIGELLAVIEPKAVLFLGMAGGVHPSLKVGDFVLPIASIRAEGVSQHFLPPQVPALPTFQIQKFVSQILLEEGYDYKSGTIHTTDFRFWEFDDRFKSQLIEERVLCVEMETAALFASCFVSKVNIGALILISDCPMKKGGIKTKKSASQVFKKYTDIHIELGIKAMAQIAEKGETMRHYQW
ncbi:MAG: AMP nucleosidase [Bacteriovoracaceae bacterium]|nr:AMP nucleosidase [Bacteriovoracaceae bacterium]